MNLNTHTPLTHYSPRPATTLQPAYVAALGLPGPAGRAALAALTGVPVTVCPPRTYALDPLTDRPKASPPPPRRARTARADPRRVVSVVPNPKKPGSKARARFQLWRVGATVDECVAAGVSREDVRYDLARSYVVVR
jgi:hypothetical protein